MPLTASAIVTLACTTAKCPGFTFQGGQCLNLALDDLVLHRDLKVNLTNRTISVTSGTNGPFNLSSDYVRTYDLFYTQNGVPYFLNPITLEMYDAKIQDTDLANYPYEFATDLSPAAVDGTPASLFIYPQSNAALTLTHRYMIRRPGIASPETSTGVPWFQDQDYLVHATALRLMKLTDDARYERFVADADKMLQIHLLTDGDEQQIVKEVKLDPRRFRNRGATREIKNPD